MDRKEMVRQVSSTIETAIVKGADLVPFARPNEQEIVKRVNELSGNLLDLKQPRDFFDPRVRIETLDAVARDYVRSAQIVATSTGGVTGALGFPGLIVDLPVLVASTAGMVRRHALVYGFRDIEETGGDRMPLVLALAVAVGADQAIERVATRVGAGLAGRTTERLLARVVSEEMAKKITTRVLARAVPLVSTATSAALDYLFLREAGRQSIKHFHDRHLLVRQQIAAAVGEPPAQRRLPETASAAGPE